MNIRAVRPDEAALLRDVRLRALADAPGAFLTTLAEALAYPDQLWQERAAALPGRVTFIGEDAADGRWWGMVGGVLETVQADTPPTVYLIAMWVDPARRGSGLGEALVRAVLDWAAARGVRRVELDVVETNAPAIGLYRRCGFLPTGERHTTSTRPQYRTLRMRHGP
ncbi:MAG TPA: GNAT family N-acetyltransferase [Dehalococcoidia bacterium]|nr:GNAT family N-acetyltransferase [Dehalococcoidia bacterium]